MEENNEATISRVQQRSFSIPEQIHDNVSHRYFNTIRYVIHMRYKSASPAYYVALAQDKGDEA